MSAVAAPTAPRRAPVLDWFAPSWPEARVAVFRSIVYAFVLLDIHLFVNDPPALSQQPDLYRPLLVERFFRLPPPSVGLTATLYLVLWVTCLLGVANRLPRVAGWGCAAAFTWWTAIGMSYGKVDHDHLALVVALWLLPTVGPVLGRWRSPLTSRQAGWALRVVCGAVVMTYFLSALTKIRSGDWSITSWPDSYILQWAIVRRPHGLGQFLLPYPDLLHVMQWIAFCAELSSPLVLFLRGRALGVAAVFWMGFHVFTLAILYIHFAPTLVCWLAFVPLERFPGWLAGTPFGRGIDLLLARYDPRRRQRAGGGAAGHLVPVRGDEPVDGAGERPDDG